MRKPETKKSKMSTLCVVITSPPPPERRLGSNSRRGTKTASPRVSSRGLHRVFVLSWRRLKALSPSCLQTLCYLEGLIEGLPVLSSPPPPAFSPSHRPLSPLCPPPPASASSSSSPSRWLFTDVCGCFLLHLVLFICPVFILSSCLSFLGGKFCDFHLLF